MNMNELTAFIVSLDEPKFRAVQIFKWLHSGIDLFEEMTDIPKKLRDKLNNLCYIANVKIAEKFISEKDGTIKYLYELFDGEFIESVLMKYKHGYTVCISTQVGCRMGCSFCASGINGLARNLTASEMLSQLTRVQKDNNIRVSNVVMMGMGEPLDNFDNTSKFLSLVSDEYGMNIGLRHISLSTSGVVPGIYKLAELNLPITLSISLHAPNNHIRDKIMKINHSYRLEELINACKSYQKTTGRRISFEYALISGLNDTDECAKQLSKLLEGIMCHINLIPANPIVETSFVKPDTKRINEFCDLLNKYKITTTIRRTLGSDINASCGQLRRNRINKEATV